MRCLIRVLTLNCYFLLDLFLHGSGSSVDKLLQYQQRYHKLLGQKFAAFINKYGFEPWKVVCWNGLGEFRKIFWYWPRNSCFSAFTDSTPQKNCFFWSNPYKIEVMITSVIEILEFPNFGGMITHTTLFDSCNEIWLVTSWEEFMTS